jgi:hypothetical protein
MENPVKITSKNSWEITLPSIQPRHAKLFGFGWFRLPNAQLFLTTFRLKEPIF